MKNKIFVITFFIILYGILLLSIISKKEDISYTERRRLKEYPKYEMNIEYSKDLEKYLLDHFPFRDNLRRVKTFVNYNL